MILALSVVVTDIVAICLLKGDDAVSTTNTLSQSPTPRSNGLGKGHWGTLHRKEVV